MALQAGDRVRALGELIGQALPDADRPVAEQAQVLLQWAERLRMPAALDDAQGRRIAASPAFERRMAERPGQMPVALQLEDGRTLWLMRGGHRAALPPHARRGEAEGWAAGAEPAARGGVAVVPVFAVGRAQAVLHTIAQLKAAGEIPKGLPIFLDSPMAIHTTALFERHPGEHRLSVQEVRNMDHVATMLETPEQSKSLVHRHGPMVILAASGMATGGRVLHHLARYAPDHRNMVILTGYQAPGTRGAALANGHDTLRIHAQDVTVRAEVAQIESASAHADANQLLGWLHKMPSAPAQVFVVHGEREASDRLRQRIEHEIKWPALVPEHGSVWRL